MWREEDVTYPCYDLYKFTSLRRWPRIQDDNIIQGLDEGEKQEPLRIKLCWKTEKQKCVELKSCNKTFNNAKWGTKLQDVSSFMMKQHFIKVEIEIITVARVQSLRLLSYILIWAVMWTMFPADGSLTKQHKILTVISKCFDSSFCQNNYSSPRP